MYFEYGNILKNSKEYEKMLTLMKEDVRDFHNNFKDDPRFVSGWGHAYFCDDDGGRLIYDREKPFSHICSICGKEYNDYNKNSCHVTMYRNEAVLTTLKAALLYNVYKDDAYYNIAKNIISFYADNYKHFVIHAKDKLNVSPTIDVGGTGKIMPQGLNEVIIAIRFLNAMELMKERLSSEWIMDVKEKLFKPIYELVLPQKMHIHNIPVWINSAFGTMGLFFNETEWIKEATGNPFNLYQLIEEGVTDSGFWYEGSIHYNFFALEGVMNFLSFAESYNFKVPEYIKDTVFKMLAAAYDYAFDNDRFPNPSDGWPNITLKTYSYIYYMSYKVFGDKIVPYIQHIENNKLTRTSLPLSEPYYYNNEIPIVRLLYAPEVLTKECEEAPKRESANFESSNCAILRNKYFNVFLKYGHQTESHAHPDKMNIEIMAGDQVLTKDLSNSGYASKLCNGWHRKIAAHNTCAVNGKPTDVSRQGKVIYFDNNTIEAEAEAYNGVFYTRRLELKDNMIKDIFNVEGKENGTIDYFFHFEDDVVKESLDLNPVDMFGEYEYILNVKEIKPENGEIILSNKLVQMKISLEDGVNAYLAKTYNNPADKTRDTLILRKKSKKARFESKIIRL